MGMEYLSGGEATCTTTPFKPIERQWVRCIYMEEMYMMAGEQVCRAVIHIPGEGICDIDGYHHCCIGDDSRVVVSVPTTGQPAGYAWIYIARATPNGLHVVCELDESGRD